MNAQESSTTLAFIRLRAARTDNYLTRAAGIVALRFCYDSQQCGRAMHLLVTASEAPNATVVPITLGSEELLIDPSLHTDLGAELLVLMVERDLGALMDEYRPDSSPLH